MRPYILKVEAGAEEPAHCGGPNNYVRLYPTASVNVTLKDRDNNQEVILRPGDDAVLHDFTELYVSHDGMAEETFTLFVGKNVRVGGAEISGNVTVIGGTVDTVSVLTGITNPLVPQVMGESAYFRDSSSAALNIIVTPAANTAGIVITNLSLYSFGAMERLMAKGSAPSTWNDPAALTVACRYETAGNLAQEALLPLPLKILPGYGLYEQASIGSASSGLQLAFEVL